MLLKVIETITFTKSSPTKNIIIPRSFFKLKECDNNVNYLCVFADPIDVLPDVVIHNNDCDNVATHDDDENDDESSTSSLSSSHSEALETHI